MSAQDSLKQWQEKYSPMLVNGLTDGPNYIRLLTKHLPALDLDLTFRPIAFRVTNNVIVMGGKLSVFPVLNTMKAEPASDGTLVGWMLSSFPTVEFIKVSKDRVGTVIAAPYQAPYDTGYKAHLDKFTSTEEIDKLLTYIEALIECPITNREQVAEALREAYLFLLPGQFAKGQKDAPAGNGAEVISLADYAAGIAATKLETEVPGNADPA